MWDGPAVPGHPCKGAGLVPDWDAAYREAPQPLFGGQPSEFVRRVIERQDCHIQSALCLADGDGRNGRWLAMQGVNVTAIDLSEVATEQALAKDRAAGVIVSRFVGDLEHWRFQESDRWDAVFLIFLQCESRVRNAIAAEACRHLLPGGWFVAEGFSAERGDAGLLGPKDPDLLYSIASLQEACRGLRVLEAGTITTELNDGVRHQGRAALARLLARRV